MQSDHTSSSWPWWRKAGFRFFVLFVLLYLFTVPFPHPFLPDPAALVAKAFEPLAGWTGTHLFSIERPFTSELVSDSTGLYLHVFNLAVIALLGMLSWSWFDRRRADYAKLSYAFVTVLSYYLAMQLFTYGFSKVFKWQFYLPEPNTLFTTLGETPRDLLYWSTMGTSRAYSIFTGSAEVLAALLLLFRRTRLAGALGAFAVLLNVVAINFSFDISVKLYSCFLVLLSLLIMAPDTKRLLQVFFRGNSAPAGGWTPQWDTKQKKLLYATIKTSVLILLLADALFPYVSSGIYNDDKAPRPELHGAYDVRLVRIDQDTIEPSPLVRDRWKRVFIHRRGYFITQLMDDKMQDYELAYLPDHNLQINLAGEQARGSVLHYTVVNDSIFFLDSEEGRHSLHLELKKINLEKLPLLQNEFNWTAD